MKENRPYFIHSKKKCFAQGSIFSAFQTLNPFLDHFVLSSKKRKLLGVAQKDAPLGRAAFFSSSFFSLFKWPSHQASAGKKQIYWAERSLIFCGPSSIELKCQENYVSWVLTFSPIKRFCLFLRLAYVLWKIRSCKQMFFFWDCEVRMPMLVLQVDIVGKNVMECFVFGNSEETFWRRLVGAPSDS